jgi:hypothetical protein
MTHTSAPSYHGAHQFISATSKVLLLDAFHMCGESFSSDPGIQCVSRAQ